MNSVVNRIVSNSLFIRPVAGFLMRLVDAVIDDYRVAQLYAETRTVDKK